MFASLSSCSVSMASRIRIFLTVPVTLSLFACQTTPGDESVITADYLLEDGRVFDGTGAGGRIADIAIKGDRIIFVGDSDAAGIKAETRINASSLIVAPGFIDPHTHALGDLQSPAAQTRSNLHYLFQGVTTVVTGNDGGERANIAAMARKLQQTGIGTNAAFYVGFGKVRTAVLGRDDRQPDSAELERMRGIVHGAMCEGALGLSTGLYYAPQNFAATSEVVELAKIAARFDGVYDTHLRDESSYNIGLIGAVSEVIEIGKQAGMPVHIAHIKALGPAVWGESAAVIKLIEKARKDGLAVTADQYPWRASGTSVANALVPRWALEGGLEKFRLRLTDATLLKKIKAEMADNLKRRAGAQAILITAKLGDVPVEPGVTLAEFASTAGKTPVDAALDILKAGNAKIASFNMKPSDISAFAKQGWVVTSSDGSVGHPRKYASFPKAYQDYVKGEKLFSMTRFIRRSSGQTADLLGLKARGYLQKGKYADIVIFDAGKFAPRATYRDPKRYSVGVRYVFVNGELAISNGQSTGILRGRVLLRQSNGNQQKCPKKTG